MSDERTPLWRDERIDEVIGTRTYDGEVIYVQSARVKMLQMRDDYEAAIAELRQPPVPQPVEMTPLPLTLLGAIVKHYIREIVAAKNTPEHIAECKDALAAIQAAQQRPGAEEQP